MTDHKIQFPAELPVSQHREEIERAIRENQTVIICGDTGSGKTTQLPKMALELGRGANGKRIACTQPRRLAAVTVAKRVADEFHETVGNTIGYQHRFEKKVSADTRIKFMTDGVLLAETRHDPMLRAYDTIIIDEAHERSLNIDFLLGILKRIAKKRRDLKIIVSSATLDAGLFSEFFDNAPALSIPGRLFPIEISYQPQEDDEETDLARDVRKAVTELPSNGDILVFLPGERDIRECAEALQNDELLYGDEIIPLIASLPASEQQKAFRLSSARRIILSTNVAETSVTIPGIRYVIDSGLARISRYIHRTQVQRLQIEPISQASANQRSGRCGRLGPGKCIRLYDEESFERRDRFTAPEILRSSLAGVILTMLDLNMGDVTEFPFITPPENTMIREGIRELTELGAITINDAGLPTLTAIGRKLAQMPVEPRIGRIILAGDREAVLPSILPLAAYMACDDPRRRPIEEKEKADQAHSKFKSAESDFASTLKLWHWWIKETENLSQRKARALCKTNYLSYSKMREWRDLEAQLRQIAKRINLDTNQDTGGDEAIRRALLSGLLSRIGVYDEEAREFRGARGIRFAIHPSSAICKNFKPATSPTQKLNSQLSTLNSIDKFSGKNFVFAAELVDTSRLFARQVAPINRDIIEKIAGPLCRHSYNSPEWDAQNGFVRAYEQVTLYGLVIVEKRRCDYTKVNPEVSRDIFIRRGIIDGTIANPPPALKNNFKIIQEMKRRADRLRKVELFDEDTLVAFFDANIPKGIASAHELRKWLYKAKGHELDAFRLKARDWLEEDDDTGGDFPGHITISGIKIPLSYKHSLNDEEDGITCTVKASEAHVLKDWHSEWLVPGAIGEKLSWMIAALPSRERRILSPVEDTVARLMTYLRPGETPLNEALSTALRDRFGVLVYSDAWDKIRFPAHFFVRYRIIDDTTRKTIALTRNLDEALSKIKETQKNAPETAHPQKSSPKDKTSQTCTKWDFGKIEEEKLVGEAGWQIHKYPGLTDNGDSVSIAEFTDKEKALQSHSAGITRLYLLNFGKKTQASIKFPRWQIDSAILLKNLNYTESKIAEDLIYSATMEAFVRDKAPIRTKEEFEKRVTDWQPLSEAIAKLMRLTQSIIPAAAEIITQLSSAFNLPEETKIAVKNQLDWLVFTGFIKNIPLSRLEHYPRYLESIRKRLEKARLSPSQDMERERKVQEYWMRYRNIISTKEMQRVNRKALVDYRWMIEEYRVSLFTQELRTPAPVSTKRLDLKWDMVISISQSRPPSAES